MNPWQTTRGERMRWRFGLAAVGGGLVVVLAAGCALQEQQTLQSLDQPINCRTAEGDIRVLQSEKANVAQQVASGVTAIAPAGIVVGALTGTEGTKLTVATGDYNNQIDARIAAIRSRCGL
jgi:hypothetical protein